MILALDLGSTSFKAAVLDRRLRLLGFGRRPIQHRFAPGGRVELDVEEACTALAGAIREAIRSADIQAATLRAVGLTSQAQTFTVISARGRPLLPFISWQDTRAAQACARLRDSPVLHELPRHCSFGTLLPALQLCQLKHLQTTRPQLLAAPTRVVQLPTFFVQRWTGTAVIDENLAAMSGLYSLATRTWWPAALRACGLREDHLPRVGSLGGVAGETGPDAARFGLPQGIPVVLAGNDQTAGAHGAGLSENRALLVTLGTAQVAYAYCNQLPRAHPALVRGPFPHGGYYRLAADSLGGNLVNWAKTALAGCATDGSFFRQAALASPGCQGLDLAPGDDPSQLTWRNLGLHHAPPDFARSVLECLTQRMAGMIRQLGRRPTRTKVLVAGGGSASSVWVRMLAETLGTPVALTSGQPFLGAARMALAALEPLEPRPARTSQAHRRER